jgi:O-6-methylguanine DNA methyltransferase
MAFYDLFASPVGPIFVGGVESGLVRVEFQTEDHDLASLVAELEEASGERAGLDRDAVRPAITALASYFAGVEGDFDLPIAPHGTPFQLRVWREVAKIHAGQTASYGRIARALRKPKASRAVGAAVGSNPLVLVVPCHRVIASDGGLGGYGGGLDRKRWLLRHEARWGGAAAAVASTA